MRAKPVLRVVGTLLAFVGLSMLISAGVALFYAEEDLTAHLIAALATLTSGGVLFFSRGATPKKVELSHKEAFTVVTLGWALCCIFGALPFFFFAHGPAFFFEDAANNSVSIPLPKILQSPPDCEKNVGLGREFCSFTNSVFESTSGFTTTGATILEKGLWADKSGRKGGLPHGLLFWRAATHFLGGMGIIVLGVAILPLLGVGGMQLFKAEVPGPVKDKMAPRVAETARLLWKVYAGLTIAQVLLLLTTGQGAFLSICHSFATMATGGFSPLASSIESLNSPLSEWIISFFMLLAGANFSLHLLSLRSRRPLHWKDQEFRFYSSVAFLAALAISFILFFKSGWDPHDSIRAGVFQTISVLTTTGFSTSDFGKWGAAPQIILFSLFFIGGSAGSTGGGMKCVRIFLMFKVAVRELGRLIHPHAVIQTKLSGKVVSDNVIHSVAGFVILYLGIYLTSTIIFGLFGYDLSTSLTAVGATLGNIGPGLGPIGPSGNYNFIESPLKWLSIFNMLAGRLEIYSVIILLTPEFWRR